MKPLIFALLLLLSALPHPASARDDFKNLPGVRDPAKLKARTPDPDCTSRLLPRRSASGWNGLSYRSYSCRYGSGWLQSDQPPNLIEYRKFREYYD